eukprot:TRINITY_DN4875_c0_g7_i3.p1 TRINITY_DN4875_c0_g7~~TRINITY_DN4875_c0_g7_i3.p1  ORF type:complete len:699 (+),score=206.47 TRINITY_DN4875_c0_g7_i3:197-2098(+)
MAVGYWFPYAVGILSKGVEVKTNVGGGQSTTSIQKLNLNKAKMIVVQGDILYVSSSSDIWRLIPIPIIDQIDDLLRRKEFDQALAFCESLPDLDEIKNKKLKEVRCFYAYFLFAQGHFSKSLRLFYDIKIPVVQVIGLFPNTLTPDTRAKIVHPVSDLPKFTGNAYDASVDALIEYLIRVREESQPINLMEIIDTTLITMCVVRDNEYNDSLISKILSNVNYCNPQEGQKILFERQKFKELCLLFKSKGMHKDALKLLTKLGQNKNQPLYGPTFTINYLKELGNTHLDLILEYSKWVIGAAPLPALDIFTKPRLDDDLNRMVVLEHLKAVAPPLVVPYLETIINEREESKSEFHNELISKYLDFIKSLTKSLQSQKKSESETREIMENLIGTKNKLLFFLKSSLHYTPQKILTRILNEIDFSLHEETAILFSRIGHHEQALNIYANHLKNFALAENYCKEHYHKNGGDQLDDQSESVYLSLLKVYLNPPPGSFLNNQIISIILDKYFHFMDPAKVIELLPDSMPINSLKKFFEVLFLHSSALRKDQQVIKGLLHTKSLRFREYVIRERNEVIIRITDESVCPVCKKKILTSVFARYPNGVVVHLGCAKDRNVCPITKTNFKPNQNQEKDDYEY